LSRAQAWLREATTDELSSEVKIAAAQGRLEARHLGEIEKALTSEGLMRSRRRLLLVDGLAESATPSLAPAEARIRPYAHPYFWAGFIYTGL
jgi:CHAT domain-containing protein